MRLQANLTSVGLLTLVAASAAIRIIAFSLPEITHRLPFQTYARSLNFADAAENVLSARGQVINSSRIGRVVTSWIDSGTRLPPELSEFAFETGDSFKAFYDEQGYLLLHIGLAKLVGAVQWSNVLYLQAILSGIATGLVFLLTRRLWPGWLPWLFAFLYAINPLEILLSITPDLPIWAIYASVVGAAIVLSEWRIGRWGNWALLFCAGVFLGICVVIRGPTLGIVLVAIAGLLFVSTRSNWFAALAVAFGCLVSVTGLNAIAEDGPNVGRPGGFYTLLGGLAEFGHIEDLEWSDSSIYAYLDARYGVEPLTPEFNEAARTEYLKVVRDRPELLLIVPGRRLIEFIFRYRPGKPSATYVVPFGIFKILAVISAVVWWRKTHGRRERRRIVAYLAVASATVAVHIGIVPLLEVYIAPFLVLWSFPIAGVGAYVVRHGLQGPNPSVS